MGMNKVLNNENLIEMLKKDSVVVMPTDTIYGIVGNALNVSVVNRIYNIRKRSPEKPCIILIGDISELKKFSIIIKDEQKTAIKKYWSFDSTQNKFVPVSIIFECPDETLSYLHRGTKTLAFRLPAEQAFRDLLLKTGPLIAPSANLEGLPPAQNIYEAKKYFGNAVDLYIDGGTIGNKASKIIKLRKDGSVSILRK